MRKGEDCDQRGRSQAPRRCAAALRVQLPVPAALAARLRASREFWLSPAWSEGCSTGSQRGALALPTACADTLSLVSLQRPQALLLEMPCRAALLPPVRRTPHVFQADVRYVKCSSPTRRTGATQLPGGREGWHRARLGQAEQPPSPAGSPRPSLLWGVPGGWGRSGGTSRTSVRR